MADESNQPDPREPEQPAPLEGESLPDAESAASPTPAAGIPEEGAPASAAVPADVAGEPTPSDDGTLPAGAAETAAAPIAADGGAPVPDGAELSAPEPSAEAETAPTIPDEAPILAEAAAEPNTDTPPTEPAVPAAPTPGSNAIHQSELDALAAELESSPVGKPRPAPPAAENKIDQSELDQLTAELGAPANAASPTATITGDGSVVDDPIAAAMAAAIAGEAEDAADPVVLNTGGIATSADDARPFSAPDFGSPADLDHSASIELLDDVKLDVKIELGRTDMYIEDVLHLGVGSVVELDKLAGDPVDIYVNERLIARGEVLVLNDNFCVRINDIHSPIPELDGV